MNLAELNKLYVTELRNNPNINSEVTISSYTAAMNKFYKENSRIYRMTKVEIKEYLAHIRDVYSDSYYNVIGSSVKIFFGKVLNQPNKMTWFQSIRTKRQFKDIISVREFESMMKSTNQIKHKFMIIFLYSTGVRSSEFLNIKLKDIDWLNKRIFINSSKNGKNRYVQLHEMTEKYLTKYLKTWNPKYYLIEGQNGDKYTPSSLQKVVKKSSNNKYTPHDLRHTFATITIEHEDVFYTMELLGHSSLKSTLHYNHIATDRLRSSYNPLDYMNIK